MKQTKKKMQLFSLRLLVKKFIDVWCAFIFLLIMTVLNFLVPLQLYGEGEYNLNVVTEVDITEGFKSLIGWLNPVKPCFCF